MEINIRWNICRICLKEEDNDGNNKKCNDNVDNILKDIFRDKKTVVQIFECTGVMMRKNDCLPEKICRKCCLTLRFATNFRNTCRKSDEYLRAVIKKAKSASAFFNPEEQYDTSNEQTDTIFNDEDVEEDKIVNSKDYNKKRKEFSLLKKSLSRVNLTSNKDDTKKIVIEEYGEADTVLIDNESTKELDAEKINDKDGNNVLHSKTSDGPTEIIQVFVSTEENEEEINDIDLTENHVKNGAPSSSNTSQYTINYIQDKEDNDNEDDANDDEDDNCNKIESLTSQSQNDMKSVLEGNEPDIDSRDIDNNIDDDVNDGNGHGEFYYVLSDNSMKREYNHCDDSNDSTFFEVLELEDDDDDKSESTTVNVEYLVDDNDGSEEPSSISYGEKKEQVVSKNRRTAKHVGKTLDARQTKSYVCDICGNSFTNRSLLTYHMRVHRKERNYECELCFKRYSTACNLSTHMRIHTGEKPYACKYCNRRFTDRSTHIKHERVHTNEKPFTCNVCHKSFSLSTSLKAHQKVHTGEKAYKCETCEKAFKLPHQLKAHFKTHFHKLLALEQDILV